ncbi:MAG: hypothetical protein LBQ86_07300 [Holophagales bacterium]|jgi:predicted HicB family RNase H-like nuclease|nr:hypothetical protein [Holophagales bacterium]
MNHTVQYKGYTASIEYSDEDACYVGHVMGMDRHRIAFHGNTIEETHSAFIEMIDFYLDTCAEEGTEPERPSAIVVLLPTSLYLEASEKAEHKGLTVPKLIAEALTVI